MKIKTVSLKELNKSLYIYTHFRRFNLVVVSMSQCIAYHNIFAYSLPL